MFSTYSAPDAAYQYTWRIKSLAPPCEALKEGWPRIKKMKRYL